MPTLEETRNAINANPLFVQMQLDGYNHWEVCPGCADLYAYKATKEQQPIFLENEEFQFGRCQAGMAENINLDAIEDPALLERTLATFEFSQKKRDEWIANKDRPEKGPNTPSEG